MALIGLRTLLAAGVGGIGLLFTLSTAALIEGEAERRLTAQIHGQLREYADNVAQDLDRGMSERYSDLLVVATLDTIRSAAASPEDQGNRSNGGAFGIPS
jgi:hypothetical protein